MLGIAPLRERLSQLLEDHLRKELPALQGELEQKLLETSKALKQIGPEKATIAAKRQYLMGLSIAVHDILRAAVHGNYEHHFFGSMNLDAAIDSPANIRRLRAVIQHLNIEFAAGVRRRGHKYAIHLDSEESRDEYHPQDDEKDGSVDAEQTNDAPANCSRSHSHPQSLGRAESIQWTLRVLQRSRGHELPGTFNPLLISHLFWEQSEPWQPLALAHISKVAAVCNRFVHVALEVIAPADIGARFYTLKVEAALRSALTASRSELEKVVRDEARHPMTYNHYFTTTVQKMRQSRNCRDITFLTDDAKVQVQEKNHMPGSGYELTEYLDHHVIQEKVRNYVEQEMEHFSAREALESLIACYKVGIVGFAKHSYINTSTQDEWKYFIGVVTKQVIERHLVETLPSEILSPMIISGLTDDEVKQIATEPASVNRQRTSLEARRVVLE